MSKSCSKCSAGVNGVEDIPATKLASAVAAAIITAELDKAVTVDATTGAPKDNFFAKNPMAKNAAYVAAGLFLTTMDGDMYQGAGEGMVVYGGYNIISEAMEKAGSGSIGGTLNYIAPQSITGQYGPSSTSAYGINPSVLGTRNRYRVPVYKNNPSAANSKMPKMSKTNPILARAV